MTGLLRVVFPNANISGNLEDAFWGKDWEVGEKGEEGALQGILEVSLTVRSASLVRGLSFQKSQCL